ncbi:MAG: pitrilysin family protein [Patescibacteria group bacterium]
MKNSSLSKFTLPNGLRVITQHLPSVDSITIYLTVGAGPRFETEETAGLAHFLEHMLFEGTDRFPSSKELSTYIESVGGRSGAFTEKEFVLFYVKIPKKNVNIGIHYLSEILFRSKLEDNAINKEKNIVLEELKRKLDNPEVEIWDQWFEWLWGKNQSLGKSTLGDKKSIKNITREKLEAYLTTYYVPSNMVLSIVGNISAEEIKKTVDKYFKNINDKEVSKALKLRFSPKSFPLKIIPKSLEQNQMIVGFVTGISLLHQDRFPIQILADVLSHGINSRLFHRLVYDLGAVYSTYAGNYFFSDTGLFYIYCGVSSKNIKKVTKEIFQQINIIKTTKITDKELSQTKIKTKADLVFSFESPDNLAHFYATQELLEKKTRSINDVLHKIDAVTPEDVQRVAKKYFTLNNLSFIISGSFKQSDKTLEIFIKNSSS